MKKVLSILVVVLALTLALGCFAYADEFGGAGYEEAALYKWDGTDVTPSLPTEWTAHGETFDHYEVIKAPTCAKTGVIAAVYLTGDPKTPTVVHEIEVEKTEDHDYRLVADEGATCKEKGTGRYICKICGKDKGIVVNLALVDHTFGEWYPKLAATCTKKGVDYRICSVCLKTEERDSDPLNHKPLEEYVLSKVTVEPTCSATGKGIFVCPQCNAKPDTADGNGQPASEERVLDKLPHTWGALDEASIVEPTCTATGSATHECTVCGATETVEIPALGHNIIEADFYRFTAWEPTCEYIGVDFYVCSRCGLGGSALENAYGQKTDEYPSPEFTTVYTDHGVTYDVDESKNTNEAVKIVVIPALGHDLNDWNVAIDPSKETNNKGYWTRTCKRDGCTYVEEFKGTQEEFDAFLAGKEAAAHADDKNGLINEDGEWKYYKDDVFQSDFVGMVSQDGCDFFVADGKVCMDANGLNMYNDEWYFLSLGRVCAEHTGLALYDGCWFFITNGKLDTSVTGLVDYNGGTFVFADGRLIAEYSGLYFDGTDWYFAANGQIQKDFSGSVEYDGETFVLENGKLVG